MKKLAFISLAMLSFGGVNETVWGMNPSDEGQCSQNKCNYEEVKQSESEKGKEILDASFEVGKSREAQMQHDERIKIHCCDGECYCKYLDSIKYLTKVIEELYDQNSKLREERREYDSESTQDLEYSSEPYEFKDINALIAMRDRKVLDDYKVELFKKFEELVKENHTLKTEKVSTSASDK